MYTILLAATVKLCGGTFNSFVVVLCPLIPVMTLVNIVTVRFSSQSRMTFAVVAVSHFLVFIIASHFVHCDISVSICFTLLLQVLQQG